MTNSNYKFIPVHNMCTLKRGINTLIARNNTSATKVSKAIGISTGAFKTLRDPNNKDKEITPEQYVNLCSFFKRTIDLGKLPDNYWDRFMVYLYKHNYTIEQFAHEANKSVDNIKKLFTENGVSYLYRYDFKFLTDEEFDNLNSFNKVVLSSKRDDNIIKSINAATAINSFMVKRGYSVMSLAQKLPAGYTEVQVKTVLSGFISERVIDDFSTALQIPRSTFENDSLNSYDANNNFGYYLQTRILINKMNIYSFASKIGIPYHDLKEIVRGRKNMTEDQIKQVAKELNLDFWQLLDVAPSVNEGDDKYIVYNYYKQYMNNPTPASELAKQFNSDVDIKYATRKIENVAARIKIGEINTAEKLFTNLSKELVVSISGKTISELRRPLTDDEIKDILALSKKRSSNTTTVVEKQDTSSKTTYKKHLDPNENLYNFVYNIVRSKGRKFNEFSNSLNIGATSLRSALIDNRFPRTLDKKRFFEELNISEKDIEKFNIRETKSVHECAEIANKMKHKQEKTTEVPTKVEKEEPAYTKEDVDNLASTIFYMLYTLPNFSISLKQKYKDDEKFEKVPLLLTDDTFCKSVRIKVEKHLIENGVEFDRVEIIRWGNFNIAIDAIDAKIVAEPKDSKLKEAYLTKTFDELKVFGEIATELMDHVPGKITINEDISKVIYKFKLQKKLEDALKSITKNPTVKVELVKEYGTNPIFHVSIAAVIENIDRSSLYPSNMVKLDTVNNTITGGVKEDQKEKDKEFMMEELEKFMDIFSKLDDSEQDTILRIMNTIKYPDDLAMKNIPEECFLGGRFSAYKKIDTIVKLTELDG